MPAVSDNLFSLLVSYPHFRSHTPSPTTGPHGDGEPFLRSVADNGRSRSHIEQVRKTHRHFTGICGQWERRRDSLMLDVVNFHGFQALFRAPSVHCVANWKEEDNLRGLMSKPSKPAKSKSLSTCPVFPTNAMVQRPQPFNVRI